MLEKNKIDNAIMKLADNQFLYKLDDSLRWLFNIDTGEYYKLNESSFFVLSLFDGKKTVDEIRRIYVNKYSSSEMGNKALLRDVNELLKQLMNNNVLVKIKKEANECI